MNFKLCSGVETFSGYELGPMSKSVPNNMIESQTWSSPRYITTPSSSSPTHHTCHCASNLKDELSNLHDDEKFFIQRDWLYDEMFKLLKNTTKPGLILLTRTPGMGKTWLMKNLLRYTPTSVIIRNEKSTNLSQFIHLILLFPFQHRSFKSIRQKNLPTNISNLTSYPRIFVNVFKVIPVHSQISFIPSSIVHWNIPSFMPIEMSFFANNTHEKRLH